MTGYCSVVLTEPSLSHLDRVFTYAVPERFTLKPGALVRAPFRGHRRRGVVVEILEAPDIENALPIADVIGPGLAPDVIDLARWVADRYLSTLGEAIASILPARVVSEEATVHAPHEYPRASALDALRAYDRGDVLARAIQDGGGAFVWRPSTGERRGDLIAAMASVVLARGKSVLILLPEVRVRSETVSALEQVFGEGVAWLGADRPARARYRDWLALRAGAKRVAVGGRASVFAPMPDLGLIVLDDEAHASYKEGRAPRFHARTVAAERARRVGATLVLAGSPPSVEARVASQRAPFTFVAPSRTSERRARSPVTVVDSERLVPSARTLAAMKEALANGERTLLVAHRSGDELAHIAERTFRVTGAKRPARLDAEATPAALAKAIASSDCIVATPFIVKDHAIPDIGVLAIVAADAGLAQPEFRAAEETFATWWRALRWASGAKIVIETNSPQHPAVEALVRWDPDVLARAEASRRRELRYPPFAALARIDVPSERAAEVAKEIERDTSLEVLGPADRDGGAVIIVRANTREKLLAGIAPFATRWRAADEPMRVDVDPWEVFVPRWRS